MKNGQRLMSVLLSAALFFGLSLPSLVVLHFQLNRTEIIRTCCVERFKPIGQNCCKGMCHLKKELNKAAENGGKGPATPKTEEIGIVSLPPQAALRFHPVPHDRWFPERELRTSAGYASALEHVPWAG